MSLPFFDASNYFLNSYAIPVLVVSTFVFLMGTFVLSQNVRSLNNFSFFLICLSSSVWLYGMSLMYCARFEALALDWYKYFTFLGVTQIAPSIYFFSVVWPGQLAPKKKSVVIGYILAFSFYLSSALSGYGVVGVRRYFWGFYPVYGPIAVAFLSLFVIYYIAALRNFISGFRTETRPQQRAQILYITVAYGVTFLGACDFIPKLVYAPLYPFGYIAVFLWVPIVAYSIIKYKVMDIETVIHKTLMWAVLSSLVFLPLGGALHYFKDLLLYLHPVMSSVFGVALFVLFMIYAKTIQPWIDHIFQRRKSDLKNALIRFNNNLVHLKGLTELSDYIVRTIREILYVSEVQLFLRKGREKSLVCVDQSNQKTDKLNYQSPFIQWLEKQDKPVLADFVDLDPQFQGVKGEAKQFFGAIGAKVSMPLVLNGELIGLINLAQKANLKRFSSVEVMFLSELRLAATIALSNSLRLIEMQESLRKWNEELEAKVLERTEQLKEAQKQLIQAEKLATIGVLAGGVAHEINNPLTAVLTNAQILKMNASKDDLESIQLIEAGAKRCQEIIQKIMKYARKPLGPEKTEVVNLNDVIGNVIAFLKYQIEQENIEIVAQKNGDISVIEGNSHELEQVLTNLVLNAKDAVKDVNRPGKIEIKTLTRNGTVGFVVSDNGHGIAPDNLSKIFDPFFTTKDIGKGTGLGLAVTYGIVKKYNGNIDVSSQVGEGTTFVVTFPKMTR